MWKIFSWSYSTFLRVLRKISTKFYPAFTYITVRISPKLPKNFLDVHLKFSRNFLTISSKLFQNFTQSIHRFNSQFPKIYRKFNKNFPKIKLATILKFFFWFVCLFVCVCVCCRGDFLIGPKDSSRVSCPIPNFIKFPQNFSLLKF